MAACRWSALLSRVECHPPLDGRHRSRFLLSAIYVTALSSLRGATSQPIRRPPAGPAPRYLTWAALDFRGRWATAWTSAAEAVCPGPNCQADRVVPHQMKRCIRNLLMKVGP